MSLSKLGLDLKDFLIAEYLGGISVASTKFHSASRYPFLLFAQDSLTSPLSFLVNHAQPSFISTQLSLHQFSKDLEIHL